MKKLLILVGSILLLTTKLFAADPAVGLWKSIDDKTGKVTAIWKVYEQGGKLFGAVTGAIVSEELKKQYGVDVDKKKIALGSEIKTFGDFSANIKLTHGVSCSVKIKVVEE